MKINKMNIVALRNLQGWSQEDLAAAAGISVRTVQRMETEGKASLDTAKSIAAAFDVGVEKVKEPELRWEHHKLIWRPLGEWVFWVMVITIATAHTVKFGWVTDPMGVSFIMAMFMSLLMVTLARIGLRFYDEFGPFWKKWNL